MSELLSRITIDPEIVHGKPVIRGLRYPVQTILELLSAGMSFDEILAPIGIRVLQHKVPNCSPLIVG